MEQEQKLNFWHILGGILFFGAAIFGASDPASAGCVMVIGLLAIYLGEWINRQIKPK